MKILITLAFALMIGMVYADGCCGCACCKPTFDVKAMSKQDREFLAQANMMAMAGSGNKMECCAKPEKKMKMKKASKSMKRAKARATAR